MSSNHPSEQPLIGPNPRRWLRYLSNVAIVCFFVIGTGVAAGSFGLFGCYCFQGYRMPENPSEKPADPPAKTGDMPPLPSPPK